VSPNFVRILSTSDKSVDQLHLVSGTTSKVISAESGGVITNGRITLEFPPFALGEDTEITIAMLSDGTLGADLGPHGIQFNKPVTMTMDLQDTNAEGNSDSVDTFWWNSDEDWYEKMPKVTSRTPNKISATLEHFSRYKGGVGG
jgi:hypothetical protein